MPWQKRDAASERLRFVYQFQSGGFSMTELCCRFGISRPTGYLWWNRFLDQGEKNLVVRSRRPHTSPNRTSPRLEAEIVGIRESHPSWGPVTIVAYLRRLHPEKPWPAASTAGGILAKHGLVTPRQRRRRVRHPGRPYLPMEAPNDTWSVDFKGEFKTLDGRYCYPLTMADGCSRFILACRAGRSTRHDEARPVFVETFRRYGLPSQILSDSGPPFASTALAGLSRMSVWWIRLGIHPVRIEPGHPEQNGRHERMHRTLAVTTRPPAEDLDAQQQRFNQFLSEFNEQRPHRALNFIPPAEAYQPSVRPYPNHLPELEYQKSYETRKVDAAGRISWHDRPLRISKTLCGERVALEPIEDEMFRIYFGPVLLGVFDQRTWEIHG